jgi:hypothetical protein
VVAVGVGVSLAEVQLIARAMSEIAQAASAMVRSTGIRCGPAIPFHLPALWWSRVTLPNLNGSLMSFAN